MATLEESCMATKRDSPTFISGHDLPMNKEPSLPLASFQVTLLYECSLVI